MGKLCRICLSVPSEDDDLTEEEKGSNRDPIKVQELILKIFGIDLQFHPDDRICTQCEAYLDISHDFFEAVVKAQDYFSTEIEEKVSISDVDEVIVLEVKNESLWKTEQEIESPEEDNLIFQYFNLTCDRCPTETSFLTFNDLKSHLRICHSIQNGFITCCNSKFYKRHLLLEHIQYHQDPEKFKCVECGKQFTSSKKLGNHTKTMHGPREALKHDCKVCGKRFLLACTLKTHMEIHLSEEERKSLTITCDLCNSGFLSKYKLEKHMEQVHLNKNIYVCDICAKMYKTKSQYRYHYTTAHETTKMPKVQCQECEKFFTNEKCLKNHVKGIHSEKGSHECKICGKISNTKRALRSHMRYMHKVDRKFICTICGKAFKMADGLKEHMQVHLGLAPLYNCNFCERTFNSKANMYAHRKNQHPVELENLKAEKTK